MAVLPRAVDSPSEVIKMTKKSEWAKLEKSNFAWTVAFYREGCGYCALLRPEFDEAAADLKRYARIGAIDVERSRDLASYVQQRYGFQVEGVPTIKTFVPRQHGGGKDKKPLIDTYNGERKAKPIVDAMRAIMPSFLLSQKQMKVLGALEPGPLAVFFTEKTSTPALTKALSSKFRERLRVGQMRTGAMAGRGNDWAEKCGVESPGACILYIGDSEDDAAAEGERAVHIVAGYGRKLSILSLDNWMMDYVPKSKGGMGKAERAMKKKMGAKQEESGGEEEADAMDDHDL
jgi:thiol-disulfide isomerase/thioredoxin